MPRLTVVTYNTVRERKGTDPALDALLREPETLVCLQEVSTGRALALRSGLGPRAFVSLANYGLQYLALVLPEGSRFLERRTVSLNSYYGVLPTAWSLGRALALYREGNRAWRDGLEPRVAQVARVSWRGRELWLVNTHLPFEPWLRDRCLEMLPGLTGEGEGLLVGDLNATTQDLSLVDLLQATGLRPAGTEEPTHGSGRRIDFVLYRGGFREVGYNLTRSLSDHRVVRAELEV
jgi:endonuclease/exonuclease/phosphatase family metal-dependent hydrolase